MKHQISADAKLKITATSRNTKKEYHTFLTYAEWVKLDKPFTHDWKAVAI